MDSHPLHPNLARLAAQYDEILRQFSMRQVDASAARARIQALQARDDEGVIWTIDPDSGDWLRRTRSGQWVPGRPPRSGLATPTAHDLSRDPTRFNPDSRIRFDEVADTVDGLRGATRQTSGQQGDRRSVRRWRLVVAAGLVAVLAGVGLTRCGTGPEGASAVASVR